MNQNLRRWSWKLASASLSAMGGAIACLGDCALAQITPDGTLPNNSIVTPQGNTSLIEGGTQAGSNLFHSFEQFSVPTGGEASFNNAADIQNIISRVTGKSISNIDGLLRANGTANLFLLNPNGIIFGPNASLNIGGSFLGSTASSLNFADGTQFSANAHSTTPLLTVSVPLGLQFGGTAGSIINRSRATNSSGQRVGLQVLPGKTLSLVGGDVQLDGGSLEAPGGQVELGGVAGAGTVGLNVNGNNLGLSFPNGVARADLSLTNEAIVNTSGESGGDIQVWYRRLTLASGSQIIATTLGAEPGGTLNVITSEFVELTGESADGQFTSGLYAQVYPGATGAGGNLTVETGQLIVQNGAQVSATTLGGGKSGNLTVTADKIQLIGTNADGNYPSGLAVNTNRGATGDAGNLTINTRELLIQDGAQVSAGTFGAGKGGNLTVTADKVLLFNSSPADSRFSSLTVQNEGGLVGDAGNLTISTRELLVRDGAQISAATFGGGKSGNLTVTADKMQLIGTTADGRYPSGLAVNTNRGATGDAGNLTINTRELLIQDGAQVAAGTLGSGKGGNLTVTADKVQLIGRSTTNVRLVSALSANTSRNATGDAGDLTINTGELLIQDGAQVAAATFGSGKGGDLTVTADKVQLIGSQFYTVLAASTSRGATGDAGDLTINTGELLIKDGAEATVSSFGEGVAGDLGITANSVRLDNGYITAQTRSGNGGNLNLNIADLLLMGRGSKISSTAGFEGGGGDGGNITISAPNGFIVAVPEENSDITADAFTGSGGKVTIRATNIFGIAPLSRQDLQRLSQDLNSSDSPTNDITTISQTNPSLSGTTELNTPDINPSSGLVNLPYVPVDTEVVQACQPGGSQAQSEFVITGRGGLPPNPGDTLSTDAVMVDLVTLNPEVAPASTSAVSPRSTSSTTSPIVEAQGWVINAKGNVTLIANVPTVTPYSDWLRTADCRAFNQQQRR